MTNNEKNLKIKEILMYIDEYTNNRHSPPLMTLAMALMFTGGR